MKTIIVEVRSRAKERRITFKDGVYTIRTTVAAERGKANDDIVDMLAEYLHIPKSQLIIYRGHTTRRKIIKIMA